MACSRERQICWVAAMSMALLLLQAGFLWSQETSKTTIDTGKPTEQTQVRNGTVVYVSGNDLVVRLDGGEVKNFVVPSDLRFMVDGKSITIKELKPGTKLHQTITTTSTPRTVKTIRTVKGKVWSAMPPKTVVLTLSDGTNKEYTVPEGTTFNIHGREATVFDLTKGLDISATVVTESPETVASTESTVTGKTPGAQQTPPMEGVLLVEEGASSGGTR